MSEEKYKYLVSNELAPWRIGLRIDHYINILHSLGKRCIILTEKAGQGKTNCICDFVENFIIKKKFLGVLINGNEFNNIINNSVEDVILKEISGFKNSASFEQYLSEINKYCKQSNSTFTIVIDGLNENSNIELFSQELHNFIEKIIEYAIVTKFSWICTYPSYQ